MSAHMREEHPYLAAGQQRRERAAMKQRCEHCQVDFEDRTENAFTTHLLACAGKNKRSKVVRVEVVAAAAGGANRQEPVEPTLMEPEGDEEGARVREEGEEAAELANRLNEVQEQQQEDEREDNALNEEPEMEIEAAAADVFGNADPEWFSRVVFRSEVKSRYENMAKLPFCNHQLVATLRAHGVHCSDEQLSMIFKVLMSEPWKDAYSKEEIMPHNKFKKLEKVVVPTPVFTGLPGTNGFQGREAMDVVLALIADKAAWEQYVFEHNIPDDAVPEMSNNCQHFPAFREAFQSRVKHKNIGEHNSCRLRMVDLVLWWDGGQLRDGAPLSDTVVTLMPANVPPNVQRQAGVAQILAFGPKDGDLNAVWKHYEAAFENLATIPRKFDDTEFYYIINVMVVQADDPGSFFLSFLVTVF